MVNEIQFMNYARNITGSAFIKNISLADNYSVINFYSSFYEYKNNNHNSLITKKAYKEYFKIDKKIEKIFVIENVRLLRQFPTLFGAKMTLQFDGKTYSIDIDRASLNEYLGFKVEDLKKEDDSWTVGFVNPIGYDDKKRKEFMNKFGKVY